MDLEAEIKALGTKLLALEGTIQKVAARKDATIDLSVIEELKKEISGKWAEMDGINKHLHDLIAERVTEKEKNHGTVHEPWWKQFGF